MIFARGRSAIGAVGDVVMLAVLFGVVALVAAALSF
jgi:hypothetical protein